MNAIVEKDSSLTSNGAKMKESASVRLTSQWPLLVIGGFWLFSLCFIGIAGDFPINDDWIYAEGVKHFLETGQMRLLACAPACIFHILSGAAICKVTGFSYEVLRGVGFAWACLGSFLMYGCCRELRAGKLPSLLLTLCFSANPLYMCLAFSFMTDTPAVSLTLAYLYFMLRGINKNSEGQFALSSIALIAATLVRQNMGGMGLVNLLVFALLALRKRFSPTLLVGLVVLPVVTAILADKWMLSTNDFNSLYVWYKGMAAKQVAHMLHAPSAVIPTIIQVAGEICAYLGVFFLPAVLCFLPTFKKFFLRNQGMSSVWPVACAAGMVFSFSKFIAEGRWMPFNQNLIRLPELGAHSLLGINVAALSMKWRQSLTWVSGILGFVFSVLILDTLHRTVAMLWRELRGRRSFSVGAETKTKTSPSRKFRFLVAAFAVLAAFGFQFAFTCLQSTFSDLDRYYLFPGLVAVPCLALAWRYQRVRMLWVLAVPVLLLLSAYSLAATQDLMAWNRARWQAIEALEKKGVAFEQIEGGAEYNYARDPMLFKNLILHENWYELTHRGEPPRDTWRWWSVHSEDYIISFSPVPNFEQIASNKYWSALSGNREILTLKKIQ